MSYTKDPPHIDCPQTENFFTPSQDSPPLFIVVSERFHSSPATCLPPAISHSLCLSLCLCSLLIKQSRGAAVLLHFSIPSTRTSPTTLHAVDFRILAFWTYMCIRFQVRTWSPRFTAAALGSSFRGLQPPPSLLHSFFISCQNNGLPNSYHYQTSSFSCIDVSPCSTLHSLFWDLLSEMSLSYSLLLKLVFWKDQLGLLLASFLKELSYLFGRI